MIDIGSIVKQISIIKYGWQRIRERKIFSEHAKVAEFWCGVIQQYFDNKIDRYEFAPKKELTNVKVIWQYWGQGLKKKDLPELVQICFDSVDKYKEDYQVIRLTDESIHEYIDLPDFVWLKKENPAFNRVFFSDLLRLALLKVYGGVWLDATILLTKAIPDLDSKADYFVYQRDENALQKGCWKASYAYYWNWNPKFKVNVLNSIFFAKRKGVVVSALLDLMLHYWKTQGKVIDYFFFQILYDELVIDKLIAHRCQIIDDTRPHLLQTKINEGFVQASYEEILESQSIHKLSYFTPEGVDRLKNIINTSL